MTAVRSLLFNLLFFGWSIVLMLLCLPLLLLPRSATYAAGRLWTRGTLFLLRAVVGLRHEFRGLEHRFPGPAIYAVKHQSAWETLVFPLLLHEPAYVLKRELIWVPLFGWFMWKCGMPAIDRSAGASALRKLVEEGRRVIAEARPLVIYPQGTRIEPGAAAPYQPGVAALYAQLDLPVVPVALNSGVYWGRRSFQKKPGLIVLEFLPAIPAGLPRREFMAELEQRIETASARLPGAPPLPPRPAAISAQPSPATRERAGVRAPTAAPSRKATT